MMEKYNASFQATSMVHIINHSAFQIATAPRFAHPKLKRTNQFRIKVNSFSRNKEPNYTPKASTLRSFNNEDNDQTCIPSKRPHRYNNSSNRRQRKRDPIMESINRDENIALRLVESSTRFLFRYITIPSSILPILSDGRNEIEVPLVYILSVAISGIIIPLSTWILLTVFFGVYLTLGTIFHDEYNDIDSSLDSLNNEDAKFDKPIETEQNSIIPLAAFTGALASAALLSPQGLITKNASFSLTSPVAIMALLSGGVAVAMGIWNTREDELKWEEKNIRDRIIREEKRKMENWDDEMKESITKNSTLADDGSTDL